MIPYTVWTMEGYDGAIMVEVDRPYLIEVQKIYLKKGYYIGETIFINDVAAFVKMYKIDIKEEE